MKGLILFGIVALVLVSGCTTWTTTGELVKNSYMLHMYCWCEAGTLFCEYNGYMDSMDIEQGPTWFAWIEEPLLRDKPCTTGFPEFIAPGTKAYYTTGVLSSAPYYETDWQQHSYGTGILVRLPTPSSAGTVNGYIKFEENLPSTPVCGNGILENGEECDDGNSASGDGCYGCVIETPPPPPPPPPCCDDYWYIIAAVIVLAGLIGVWYWKVK